MTAYLADKYKAVEDNLDNINTMLSNLKSMQDEVRTLIETLNGLAQDLIENTIQVPQA
jgi:prefoldin subunit 5